MGGAEGRRLWGWLPVLLSLSGGRRRVFLLISNLPLYFSNNLKYTPLLFAKEKATPRSDGATAMLFAGIARPTSDGSGGGKPQPQLMLKRL